MIDVKYFAVYCGSSTGSDDIFGTVADELGRAIAQTGNGIVYGGGRVGLMGRIADSCLAAGGPVIGVITKGLLDKEVGHLGLSRLEVVETMHERKHRMAELAEGFVGLAGGFGTLDEVFEVITWSQLGIHLKPVVLVNTKNYWAPVVAMIDNAIGEGFMPQAHRSLVRIVSDAPEAVSSLQQPAEALPPKWV
jgi:uncharacterized protein (TIGR00730 family)